MSPKKPVRGPHQQIRVYVPVDLVDEAKALAKRRDVSLDEIVSAALGHFLVSVTEAEEAGEFLSHKPEET